MTSYLHSHMMILTEYEKQLVSETKVQYLCPGLTVNDPRGDAVHVQQPPPSTLRAPAHRRYISTSSVAG